MTPLNFFEVGVLYTITRQDEHNESRNVLITETYHDAIRCLEGGDIRTYYSTGEDCKATPAELMANSNWFTAEERDVVFSRVI